MIESLIEIIRCHLALKELKQLLKLPDEKSFVN